MAEASITEDLPLSVRIGVAKNGKPFKRFAIAVERLTLAVSYVIEPANGDRQ